jgi:hypothetical protein
MGGHRVEGLSWGQSAGEPEAAASRIAAITGTMRDGGSSAPIAGERIALRRRVFR